MLFVRGKVRLLVSVGFVEGGLQWLILREVVWVSIEVVRMKIGLAGFAFGLWHSRTLGTDIHLKVTQNIISTNDKRSFKKLTYTTTSDGANCSTTSSVALPLPPLTQGVATLTVQVAVAVTVELTVVVLTKALGMMAF